MHAALAVRHSNVSFSRDIARLVPAIHCQSHPLTIGVVGNINLAKGIRIVNALAQHLLRASPETRIVIIGSVDPDEYRAFDNLTVHGPYTADALPRLLRPYHIGACLLPSIWPETFSYVTQELMALEMPIVCLDIGAPAERVRHYARSVVSDSSDPTALLSSLERAARLAE